MYFRSLAGQHQAKAASQWGFFQAKKMRGTTLETAADLGMLFHVKPIDESVVLGIRQALERAQLDRWQNKPAALASAVENLNKALVSEAMRKVAEDLTRSNLPEGKPSVDNPALSEILRAIRGRVPESQTVPLIAVIRESVIEDEITKAEATADAFDRACEPITESIRTLEQSIYDLDRLIGNVPDLPENVKALAGAIHGAALSLRFSAQDFNARRYSREAQFNQLIGELYEVQVRRAGYESERHRIRSRNFFYAMLCAQAGVTLASFALARTRQSAFWLVAGLAGLLALGLGAYVYLAM
jgi:hypothetical protein